MSVQFSADDALRTQSIQIVEESARYLLEMIQYFMNKTHDKHMREQWEILFEKVGLDPESSALVQTNTTEAGDAAQEICKNHDWGLKKVGNGLYILNPKDKFKDLQDELAQYSERVLSEQDTAKDYFTWDSDQNGLVNEAGERIKVTNSYGDYLDQEGNPVFSPNFPDVSEDDRLSELDDVCAALGSNAGTSALNNRPVFKRVYVEGQAVFVSPDGSKNYYPKNEWGDYTDAVGERHISDSHAKILETGEFTRTLHGNMRDEQGKVHILYNRYGDYVDEQGSLHLNDAVSDWKVNRAASLREGVLLASFDDDTYKRDPQSGDFIGSHNYFIAYDEDGGYVDSAKEYHKPSYVPDAEKFIWHVDAAGNMVSDDQLHHEIIRNQYGDFASVTSDGSITRVLNTNIYPADEKGRADRRALLDEGIRERTADDTVYERLGNGNFRSKSGNIVIAYQPDGSYYDRYSNLADGPELVKKRVHETYRVSEYGNFVSNTTGEVVFRYADNGIYRNEDGFFCDKNGILQKTDIDEKTRAFLTVPQDNSEYIMLRNGNVYSLDTKRVYEMYDEDGVRRDAFDGYEYREFSNLAEELGEEEEEELEYIRESGGDASGEEVIPEDEQEEQAEGAPGSEDQTEEPEEEQPDDKKKKKKKKERSSDSQSIDTAPDVVPVDSATPAGAATVAAAAYVSSSEHVVSEVSGSESATTDDVVPVSTSEGVSPEVESGSDTYTEDSVPVQSDDIEINDAITEGSGSSGGGSSYIRESDSGDVTPDTRVTDKLLSEEPITTKDSVPVYENKADEYPIDLGQKAESVTSYAPGSRSFSEHRAESYNAPASEPAQDTYVFSDSASESHYEGTKTPEETFFGTDSTPANDESQKAVVKGNVYRVENTAENDHIGGESSPIQPGTASPYSYGSKTSESTESKGYEKSVVSSGLDAPTFKTANEIELGKQQKIWEAEKENEGRRGYKLEKNATVETVYTPNKGTVKNVQHVANTDGRDKINEGSPSAGRLSPEDKQFQRQFKNTVGKVGIENANPTFSRLITGARISGDMVPESIASQMVGMGTAGSAGYTLKRLDSPSFTAYKPSGTGMLMTTMATPFKMAKDAYQKDDTMGLMMGMKYKFDFFTNSFGKKTIKRYENTTLLNYQKAISRNDGAMQFLLRDREGKIKNISMADLFKGENARFEGGLNFIDDTRNSARTLARALREDGLIDKNGFATKAFMNASGDRLRKAFGLGNDIDLDPKSILGKQNLASLRRFAKETGDMDSISKFADKYANSGVDVRSLSRWYAGFDRTGVFRSMNSTLGSASTVRKSYGIALEFRQSALGYKQSRLMAKAEKWAKKGKDISSIERQLAHTKTKAERLSALRANHAALDQKLSHPFSSLGASLRQHRIESLQRKMAEINSKKLRLHNPKLRSKLEKKYARKLKYLQNKSSFKFANTWLGRFLDRVFGPLAKLREEIMRKLMELLMKFLVAAGKYIAIVLLIYFCLLTIFAIVVVITGTDISGENKDAHNYKSDQYESGEEFIESEENKVYAYTKTRSIYGNIYYDLLKEDANWNDKLKVIGVYKEIKGDAFTDTLYDELGSTKSLDSYSNTGDLMKSGMMSAGSSVMGPESVYFDKNAYAITANMSDKPTKSDDLQFRKGLDMVDLGNMLEYRGYPQEGYTSNAKMITAMCSTFFNQSTNTKADELENKYGHKGSILGILTTIYQWINEKVRAFCTWLDNLGIKMFNSGEFSDLEMIRTYAAPIWTGSHQENMFLSKFVNPTIYTMQKYGATFQTSGDLSSGYRDFTSTFNSKLTQTQGLDKTKVLDKYGREPHFTRYHLGNATTGFSSPGNISQEENFEAERYYGAANARVGSGKEGGSGTNVSSDVAHNGVVKLVDVESDPLIICPDKTNFGYGCMSKNQFYYRLGAVADHKLYFKSSSGQYIDVSSDVSPMRTDDELKEGYVWTHNLWHGFNDAGVYITERWNQHDPEYHLNVIRPYTSSWSSKVVSDQGGCGECTNINSSAHLSLGAAKECWDFISGPDECSEGECHGGDGAALYSRATTLYPKHTKGSYYRGYIKDKKADDGSDAIDGQAILFSREEIRDDDDNFVEYKYYKYVFNHNCCGSHTGYYCGGHLKLKIRGLIFGFTKHQMEQDLNIVETRIYTASHPLTSPKVVCRANGNSMYKPGVKDDHGADLTGNQNIVIYQRNAASGSGKGYSEGYLTPEAKAAYGQYDRALAVEDAKDLFEIDAWCIKRPKASVPQHQITWWDGWTASNMGDCTSKLFEDWGQLYGLADTSGSISSKGVYNGYGSYGDQLTSNQMAYIVLKLQEQWENAHGGRPYMEAVKEALENKESIDTSDVLQWRDRIQHVQSAMNCIGRVNYSQKHHSDNAKIDSVHRGDVNEDPSWESFTKVKEFSDPYYKGHTNYIPGMLSDCSGFVSNIWYDRNWGGLITHGSGGDDMYDAANNIRTTAAFRAMSGPHVLGTFAQAKASGKLKPGCILVTDSHALLYIGSYYADSLGEAVYNGNPADSGPLIDYVIDCTTVEKSRTNKLVASGSGLAETNSGISYSETIHSGDVRLKPLTHSYQSEVICVIDPEMCAERHIRDYGDDGLAEGTGYRPIEF